MNKMGSSLAGEVNLRATCVLSSRGEHPSPEICNLRATETGDKQHQQDGTILCRHGASPNYTRIHYPFLLFIFIDIYVDRLNMIIDVCLIDPPKYEKSKSIEKDSGS